MTAVLEGNRLSRVYRQGGLAEPVLHDVSLALRAGETALVLGPSGSGKTTLLSILGCLLAPSGGELRIGGQPVDHHCPQQLTALRRSRLGFVFQHAQLLPFLTVEENLTVVGRNAGLFPSEAARCIDHLLGRLDIGGLRRKRPDQLSGGQQQRATIARALIHRPGIVLADEPTAALDGRNAEAVMELLTRQARDEGAVLLTVTHDARLTRLADHVFHLEAGRLYEP
ncbi:MAG: ABC transporter ATP-binding protein [Gemmataceae bacterium]|nr:ABC transporter ATP-binding protein [Gemmataceae bacterium]